MITKLMRTGTFYLRSRGYATSYNNGFAPPNYFGLSGGDIVTMSAESGIQFEYLDTGQVYTYAPATSNDFLGPSLLYPYIAKSFGQFGDMAWWGDNDEPSLIGYYSLLNQGVNYLETPSFARTGTTYTFGAPSRVLYKGEKFLVQGFDYSNQNFLCISEFTLAYTYQELVSAVPTYFSSLSHSANAFIISPIFDSDNFSSNYIWFFTGNNQAPDFTTIWVYDQTGILIGENSISLSDPNDNTILQEMFNSTYAGVYRMPYVIRNAPYSPNAAFVIMPGYYDGGQGILHGDIIFVIGADGSWYEKYTIAAAPDDALAVACVGISANAQAFEDASFFLDYAPTAGAGAGPQLYYMRSTTIPGLLLSVYLEAETVLPRVTPLPLECVPCASVLFNPP